MCFTFVRLDNKKSLNVNVRKYMRSYDPETAVSVFSSSIRFLYVFFAIFVFGKNWLQISVQPKRGIICCVWLLSTGNLSRSKQSL